MIRLKADLYLFSSNETVLFNGGSLTAQKDFPMRFKLITQTSKDNDDEILMELVVRQIAGIFYFAKFNKVELIL